MSRSNCSPPATTDPLCLFGTDMVGYARQQGISSFWSDSTVDTSAAVDMHWADADGNSFTYAAVDTRCVLVDSRPGIACSMFARMEPCHKRLGDGVVCEAATNYRKSTPNILTLSVHMHTQTGCYLLCAAPPPLRGHAPPDAFHRAPAPPPPPVALAQSRLLFVREQVRPRTELLCSGIEEGRAHRDACRAFAEYLVKPKTYGFIPIFQP